MLLARTDTLPEDTAEWSYRLRMDGFRAIPYRQDAACSSVGSVGFTLTVASGRLARKAFTRRVASKQSS
jgi:hypothetical protein